jgi:molybdopterin-guanine dinucleotide biosynthesis protein A
MQHPSVTRFLEEAGAVGVHFGTAGPFMNVNTLEDLQRAETLLAARRR